MKTIYSKNYNIFNILNISYYEKDIELYNKQFNLHLFLNNFNMCITRIKSSGLYLSKMENWYDNVYNYNVSNILIKEEKLIYHSKIFLY